MWIVRHALPWACFEDPTLRAAFSTANRGAVVQTSTWAAKQSVELFSGLHHKAINNLIVRNFHIYISLIFHSLQLISFCEIEQENEGKFCLIHDVWTTKGNRYAFVGATANYINSNWEYKFTHLTLKMVAWRHFGALLARPVGRFLVRHGLHKKISQNHFFFSHLSSFFLLLFTFLLPFVLIFCYHLAVLTC